MTTSVIESAVYAAHVKRNIEEGFYDEFLRGLYDAIVARKREVESSGSIPPQREIGEPIAMATSVAAPVAPPSMPAAQTTVSATPYRKKRPPLPRPDASVPANMTKVPFCVSSCSNDHVFINDGVYDRWHIVNRHILINQHFGISKDVRAKVVGVGPKAVKLLLVDEVPPGTINKEGRRSVDLYVAWQNNDPFYMPHSVLNDILERI